MIFFGYHPHSIFNYFSHYPSRTSCNNKYWNKVLKWNSSPLFTKLNQLQLANSCDRQSIQLPYITPILTVSSQLEYPDSRNLKLTIKPLSQIKQIRKNELEIER